MCRFTVAIALLAGLLCVGLTQARPTDGGLATITESIPMGVDLQPKLATHDAWLRIIQNAQHTIDIAAFYFSLTAGSLYWPKHDGGSEGADIYQALRDAHRERGVAIRIVINEPDASFNDTDAFQLEAEGVATVRNISWSTIFGGGILHTKLLLVDGTSGYIGSCNFGWDSLTQVKELGVLLENAPDIISDTQKVFEQYWLLAETPKLPQDWPDSVKTSVNSAHPGQTVLNGQAAQWWVSASPGPLCAPTRTPELDSITQAINQARTTVSVSVMDYLPTTQFANPNTYFAPIDDALRGAAFRGVKVRLLVAQWNHSAPDMFQYLNSLNALQNVQVLMFHVPDLPNQEQVPFTRVNHAKYMVTDDIAYITTQNWSGDYFLTTGGVGIAIQQPDFVAQLQAVFDRDWTSQYTLPVPPNPSPHRRNAVIALPV